METCDVVVAGGGPAGSACAWSLRAAGLDVVVIDAAVFPRDKVCAGWITPQVVADLRLDVEEYQRARTFQPITGFRVGVIDDDREVETAYDRPVSFGIRRCEFDHYLLQRCGARLKLGTPIDRIRRDGADWVVNDSIRAPMLVGAGGHFCAVARWLNGEPASTSHAPLVVAQEVEFAIDPREAGSFTTAPETPELYFSRDLKGYGWCFRKRDYLNVGIGRLNRRSLPNATAEFVTFLASRAKIARATSWQWRGHAYLLHAPPHRRIVDASVMLVGDAAGLAYPESGEGIRPAIESGLVAASTIIEAKGDYSRDRLELYERRVRAPFGPGSILRAMSHVVPPTLGARLAGHLLRVPGFVRHVVLDRWFLHAHESAFRN